MNEKGNPATLKPIKGGLDAREKGRLGGIKSGESRRKKASIKKAFEAIAALPCKDMDVKQALEKAGLPSNSINTATVLAWSMIQTAMAGNPQAMRLCLELMGEDPGTKLRERSVELKERVAGRGLDDEDVCITVNLVDL